jgi:L-ribulose-5-phosphate 3-epimerase
MVACAWELGIRRYVTEMWDVGLESWEDDIRFACGHMSALLDAQAAR